MDGITLQPTLQDISKLKFLNETKPISNETKPSVQVNQPSKEIKASPPTKDDQQFGYKLPPRVEDKHDTT
eukprot:7406182-Ditylum_brightwellii.AAC.1